MLKIKCLLQTRQEQVDVHGVSVLPSCRTLKNPLEVFSSALTEGIRKLLVHTPMWWEDGSMLVIIRFQYAIEPCISPRDVVERPGLEEDGLTLGIKDR